MSPNHLIDKEMLVLHFLLVRMVQVHHTQSVSKSVPTDSSILNGLNQ